MELSTEDSSVFDVQGVVNGAVWFTVRVLFSFCVMEIVCCWVHFFLGIDPMWAGTMKVGQGGLAHIHF